jgi:uncharacterized repeat protein (TIGR02543 family)
MKTKTAVAVWLSVAGLCLAAAGTVRGASGTLPAPPAGWGDCDVLDYVAEGGGGPAARGAASAGGTVERWLVRDAAAGTRYALERRSDGGRGMSVCAYSPNRVLATLRPGNSYEAFAAELAAKGMRIVRQLMEDLDGNPVYLIEAEDTESDLVDQMTMGIEETGVCSQVEPDHIFSASVVPNDQNYGLQWGLEKIGAPEAWETRTDASSVLVAVLDTGINHDHFDLNRNLWLNEADLPGDGVDDDGNGIVDDTFGVSCLDGNLDGNTADDNGHGTHCAGIIGAEGNNRRLVAGVAWRAKIMALKFLNKSGRGSTSDAITCLRYAQEHGVRIVNCSFGSTDWDDYLYAQMLKMGQAGVVFVCAAGNAEPGERAWDNDVRPFHPSNFEVDNLVAVAASDRNDNLANFSFYGKEKVDIAAPGVEIYSTVEGGSGAVGYKSGTSMATPYVAGALALLMAEYPDETPDRIVDRLYAAAEPVEALAGKVRTGARLSLAGLFGIAPPADLSATQGTVQDAVVLYWQAAKEGTHYRVWRADSERGEKTMLCDWSRGLTFSDTDAAPGVTNWYFVQAARSADGDRASSFSAGVTGFRPPVDTTRVTVEFDPAGGTVSQERVRYLIGEPYGEFPAASFAGMAFLGWFTAAEGGVRMGETSLADAETTRLHAHWIDENIPRVANLFARQRYPWNGLVDVSLDLAGVPAGEYASVSLSGTGADGGTTVPVRTFASGSFASLANGPHLAVWNAEADAPAGLCADLALSATVAVDIPPAPASGTASNNPAAGAIDLSWKAAKGASSYALSRGTSATQSAAEPLAAVTARTYRDTTAAAGAEYHYWIQSVSSGGTSAKALHLSARRGLVPTALAISGPDAVDAGTTADYSCTATLSDGSALAVTPAWSITAGAAFADSIGTRGTLTAARTATPGTVTLRAEWSTNGVSASATMDVSVRTVSVTVAFDAHGGTADPASHAYTAYGAYGTLSTATRTGYTFADWYTAASGGTEVAADSTVLPSVTTLHAHWTTNTYTVRFDKNGGTGTMADQTMTYGTAATLSPNAFAKTGYLFSGWATSAGGPAAYADKASVENLASEQGTVITLYAVWTPVSYTVRFDANGGTGTMADQEMTYGQVAALRTNAFARTGYTFAGWAKTAGGSAVYQNGADVKNLAPEQGAIVRLYAVWTPNAYTVKYDANGGTGTMADQTMTYDTAAALQTNTFLRSGYTFAGWALSAGGGVVYADGATVKNLASAQDSLVTLYAVWSLDKPTVTATGGTVGIRLVWEAVAEGLSYEVWGGRDDAIANAVLLGETKETEWLDVPADFGTTYWYWVRTVDGDAKSAYSTGVNGARVYGPTALNIFGADVLELGSNATYACRADFGDEDMVYVSPSWSISDGTAYGQMLSDGRLFASSSSAAIGKTIRVKAIYAYNGYQIEAEKNVAITNKTVPVTTIPEFSIENGVLTAVELNGAVDVTIPSTVRSIGAEVLAGTGIESVTIPNTVTNIANRAFYECRNLKSVTIPGSVTGIGYNAFSQCDQLASVTFNKGLKSIESCFWGCPNLTSISLPDGLTNLSCGAFSDCENLRYFRIGEGIAELSCCPSFVETIELPASLAKISYYTFNGCARLQSISVASDNNCYTTVNGVLYDKGKTTLICVPYKQTSYTLPATVTNIPVVYCALYGQLASVQVASGNNAFAVYGKGLYDKGKTSLLWVPKTITSISIPNTVTNIEDRTFEQCGDLTSLSIPAGVTQIPIRMCYGCDALATLSLPSTLTNIASAAFQYCTSLQSVSVPDGVTRIGSDVFSGCRSLASAYLPTTLARIGSSAFSGCNKLTSLSIPSGVTAIPEYLCNQCSSLKKVSFPSGITSIGTRAFYYCTSLARAELPEALKSVGYGAFTGCRALSSVSFPSGVTNIDGYAFLDCVSLASVELPADLKTIWEQSFAGCTNLFSVNIPANVTNIAPSAFSSCSNLTTIGIAAGNPAYYSSGNCVIKRQTGALVLAPRGATTLNVPSVVTNLPDSIFSGSARLETVTLPNSIQTIGQRAFATCTSLSRISLPSTLKEIQFYAFGACSGLESIAVPGTVRSIGSYAFAGCSNLQTAVLSVGTVNLESCAFSECTSLKGVILPSGITNIAYDAFGACSNLESVVLPDTLVSLGDNAFAGSGLSSIAIPASTIKIVANPFAHCPNLTRIEVDGNNPFYCAEDGMLFDKAKTTLFAVAGGLETVEIPPSVKTISTNAFAGCRKLESISVPSSVTTISGTAFIDCSRLIQLNIPDGVEFVGHYSAEGQSAARHIEVPKGVKRIEPRAFSGCDNLETVLLPASCESIAAWAFMQGQGTKYNAARQTATNAVRIDVDKDNPNFTSHGGMMFDKTGRTLVLVPPGLVNCKIPSSVTKIGEGAFVGNTATELIVPEGVVDIEGWAFDQCLALEAISLPASVTNIQSYAFYDCVALTNVALPQGITTLESSTFDGCNELKSVIIPASIKKIKNYSFRDCRKMESVTIRGALDSYATSSSETPFSSMYASADFVVYVTKAWTGPRGTWCGYPVVEIGD